MRYKYYWDVFLLYFLQNVPVSRKFYNMQFIYLNIDYVYRKYFI